MIEQEKRRARAASNGSLGQAIDETRELAYQSKRRNRRNRLMSAMVALALLSRVARFRNAAQGLTRRKPGYLLANALLFTPYRKATLKLWERLVEIDTSVSHPSLPIAEIDGSTYTFESLRHATDNFAKPAVVRGLFTGTPALEHWTNPEYLSASERLGDFVLSVVRDSRYGNDQDDRVNMSFREAFLDIVEHHTSKYLFFPVQSRFQLDVQDQARDAQQRLSRAVNELVRKDLQLDRIRPGFGGPTHRRFVGSQIIVGYGQRTPEETTGTGWHCAFSNNFFVQVAGGKRWYLISPEMSSFLYPVRNGVNSFMTGTKRMVELLNHIPSSYVDLGPGDMLYNPYWQWHTIMNHDGLSIGVPIREINLRSAVRNNALYSTIALVNNLSVRMLQHDIGGYGEGTGE